MNRRRQERLALLILLVGGTLAFCLGINWGLPSRRIDEYLFGDRPVWSGSQIQALAGSRSDDPTRAADMDTDPIVSSGAAIPVNETDAQRAEIVRRYRLFTHHPDEMVTLMALSEMNPGRLDFDPRMYQYGGLWVYPVGALLRLAGACRLITLVPDPTFYLDHPEEFGRFYVVARAWTAAWGLVGIWAVFRITHRLTRGSLGASITAAACFAVMPAVINTAHEAKPHLPGTVLTLLALLAAMRCLDKNERRWWIISCLLAGAAAGTVLSAWPVLAVLVVLALLSPQPRGARFAKAGVGVIICAVTYLLTNPYVPINLFRNLDLIRNNLANTRAMFHVGPLTESLPNALFLIGEGTSIGLALAGLAGIIALAVRDWRVRKRNPSVGPRFVAHWLLAAPAFVVLIQFVLFAAGQGGEYARFALLVDVTLCMAAVVALDAFTRYWSIRSVCQAVLLVATALPGAAYVESFIGDSFADNTRMRHAAQLADMHERGARTLCIDRVPAPYCLPPVNLFEWKIILTPREQQAGPLPDETAVTVHMADKLPLPGVPRAGRVSPPAVERPWLGWTEMSWAGKCFAPETRAAFLTATQEAWRDAR